eukprot:scaffold1420_cov375-Pavlova_lutheri.AAC.21
MRGEIEAPTNGIEKALLFGKEGLRVGSESICKGFKGCGANMPRQVVDDSIEKITMAFPSKPF